MSAMQPAAMAQGDEQVDYHWRMTGPADTD